MSASFGPLLRSKIVARCAMPASIVSTISGVAPFTGAEDPRGAVRAAQGFVRLQRLDPCAALKEERIEGDVADGAERGAVGMKLRPLGAVKAHAERSGHAAARVRRAAAAEGDHDAAVARIERLADELARAEGRRVGSGEAGQPVLQARNLREPPHRPCRTRSR